MILYPYLLFFVSELQVLKLALFPKLWRLICGIGYNTYFPRILCILVIVFIYFQQEAYLYERGKKAKIR